MKIKMKKPVTVYMLYETDEGTGDVHKFRTGSFC